MNPNNTLLDEFAEFIASKWTGEFRHSYAIPNKHHHVWKAWRTNFDHLSNSENLWQCDNLRQACERYSWSTYRESIEYLQMQLVRAITNSNELAVIESCLKIFEWGGVAKKINDPSRQWVIKFGGQLSYQISYAVNLLKDCSADLSLFDGKLLPMNSAMTKVYWAADSEKKLAIYDGRVGAALGLLSREFIKENNWASVPQELAFSWGSSRDKHVRGQVDKRNPSDKKLTFPRLFSAKNKDFHHALMMRKASFLLRAISSLLRDGTTVHDLERALFMVGYSVNGAFNKSSTDVLPPPPPRVPIAH